MRWFQGYVCRLLVIPAIQQQLDRIEAKLDRVLNQENQQMLDTAALVAEVQRETQVEKSVLALVGNLSTQLTSLSKQLADAIAANDPAAIAAAQKAIDDAVAELKANDDELAAAVVANTPPPAVPVVG